MSEAQYWINGVPGTQLDAADRAVQYGDGVFETLRIRHAAVEYLQLHLQRLRTGCERLGFPVVDWQMLRQELSERAAQHDEHVLKIILSRGIAGRGYRPLPDSAVTRIVSIHPLPVPRHTLDGARVRICKTRLAHQPLLAGIKHLNRLEQVLARAEWDDEDIAEGLMLDYNNNLVEGIMSNVFLVSGNVLLTPELSGCGVAGVMRSVILDLAETLGIGTQVRAVALDEIRNAGEIFVCNSLIDIWPVTDIEATGHYAIGPVTRQLQAALAHNRQTGMTDNTNWRML